MRIAIISDIHGNLAALEAVANDLRRRGVDLTVNLGDSLSGPLLPLETAQFLMAQDWVHLAGNHERQLLTLDSGQRGASDEFAHSRLTAREFDWMASLEPTIRLTPDVLLCHGTPRSDCEYLLDTVEPKQVRAATLHELKTRLDGVDAKLIVCGHSHNPRSMRTSTDQLVVNPGSVGLQAYEDTKPYPHTIETGFPDARYAVVERRNGGWLSDLISVPYSHQAMAELALARGRPEWAQALSTGRVT